MTSLLQFDGFATVRRATGRDGPRPLAAVVIGPVGVVVAGREPRLDHAAGRVAIAAADGGRLQPDRRGGRAPALFIRELDGDRPAAEVLGLVKHAIEIRDKAAAALAAAFVAFATGQQGCG